MGCPDPETISRHVAARLDFEAGDGGRQGERLLPSEQDARVAGHLVACAACRGLADAEEDLVRALGDGRTWLGPSRCITPGDLVVALSGRGDPLLHVQQHVARCAACQGELTGLSDARLLHERGATERVAPALK
ncbi:MAG: hypothetical protein KIT58_22235, partial [Planctomycetota bacterium]|nr:hypothetical protein [Planctomycetota bacterium]